MVEPTTMKILLPFLSSLISYRLPPSPPPLLLGSHPPVQAQVQTGFPFLWKSVSILIHNYAAEFRGAWVTS